MDTYTREQKGEIVCLSASCMDCKKHNRRKVAMCRQKDCSFYPLRVTLRNRETGAERPFQPDNAVLAQSFPRQAPKPF
jgi:hypothetical protein